jgi:adenosine deaminase
MSATTVTEEYWRAHQHLGFTWDELVDIALMGFDSAFMHRAQKLEMCERVRKEIESLRPAKA